MRELTDDELELVNGGVGLLGAAFTAVTAGGATAFNGGSVGEVVGATILGGVSGFFGGIALSPYSSGLTTAMFGVFSVETGILAGVVGS